MAEPAAQGPRVPVLHVPLAALFGWILLVGGDVTVGSWGTFDARLAMAWALPAVLLHAYATAVPSAGRWPRVAAWALLLGMCVHTGVLLQPVLVATLLLLAALDVLVHPPAPRAAPRPKAPLGARIAAALAAGIAVVVLALLVLNGTFEAVIRLGTATILAAALAAMAALHPRLRAPERLLPALGVYYLFFVVVAAPVLPFGPALAWWLLCLSLAAGAFVAARHTSGAEVPEGLRRHRQVVHALPDPEVAADAADLERYLASGRGAQRIGERLGAALGVPADLPGPDAQRAARERALREHLGGSD